MLSDKSQDLGLDISFTVPDGGMAIWIDVKKNAKELEIFALANDVYLVSESSFHLEQKNNQNRYIRLGFAGMKPEQLTLGLAKLFRKVGTAISFVVSYDLI